MLTATNILWDFDKEEIYEKLDTMPIKEATESIGITPQRYTDMTTEKRHTIAETVLCHNPTRLNDFMGLPSECHLPETLTDTEDISDWLSDTYGFCHKGFEVKNTANES